MAICDRPFAATAQAKRNNVNGAHVVAAVPCYNTERFIEDVVSQARKCVNQVIVIDDGSRDKTADLASAAGASVIRHDHNRGYGEAIRSCFKAARANDADVLVILDGDGQHTVDDIPFVLEPILSGEADLVIGSRFLKPNGHSQQAPPSFAMPRYREIGIRVITFLYNFGLELKVSDAQSGFRAYGPKIMNSLNPTEQGMSVSIETLIQAKWEGAVIKEVPVSCLYLSSKLNSRAARHGLGVAFGVIRLRFLARLKGIGKKCSRLFQS